MSGAVDPWGADLEGELSQEPYVLQAPSSSSATTVHRIDGAIAVGETFMGRWEGRCRGSFAIYALGLLGDGERKSLEPIAARACPDPCKTDAMHQRLLHFAVDSRSRR